MTLIRQFCGDIELRRMPWVVLGIALVLSAAGVLSITSADCFATAKRQIVFGMVGVVVFFAFALLDYRRLSGLALPLYAAAVLSLVLLFKLGADIKGVRRWYDFGPFSIQPSEPMKYVLVIALADYFCFRRRPEGLKRLLLPLVLTFLPLLLIVMQPDLGTAMLLVPAFFVMAFIAGARIRHLAAICLAGCVLMASAWLIPGGLKQYQRDRVVSFLMPARYPRSNASYNADQATIAISNGGLTGQGWGRGELNRLGRVPESHTDFIFPVIAEEWGFIGTSALILLYVALMVRLWLIARKGREPFARLLASGVLGLFAVQSLLHMAISLRLAPITGLTLPLVSYGGSSLVSTFAGLGLAASTAIHKSFVFSDEEPGV